VSNKSVVNPGTGGVIERCSEGALDRMGTAELDLGLQRTAVAPGNLAGPANLRNLDALRCVFSATYVESSAYSAGSGEVMQ
jgi:hypothetical protein